MLRLTKKQNGELSKVLDKEFYSQLKISVIKSNAIYNGSLNDAEFSIFKEVLLLKQKGTNTFLLFNLQSALDDKHLKVDSEQLVRIINVLDQKEYIIILDREQFQISFNTSILQSTDRKKKTKGRKADYLQLNQLGTENVSIMEDKTKGMINKINEIINKLSTQQQYLGNVLAFLKNPAMSSDEKFGNIFILLEIALLPDFTERLSKWMQIFGDGLFDVNRSLHQLKDYFYTSSMFEENAKETVNVLTHLTIMESKFNQFILPMLDAKNVLKQSVNWKEDLINCFGAYDNTFFTEYTMKVWQLNNLIAADNLIEIDYVCIIMVLFIEKYMLILNAQQQELIQLKEKHSIAPIQHQTIPFPAVNEIRNSFYDVLENKLLHPFNSLLSLFREEQKDEGKIREYLASIIKAKFSDQTELINNLENPSLSFSIDDMVVSILGAMSDVFSEECSVLVDSDLKLQEKDLDIVFTIRDAVDTLSDLYDFICNRNIANNEITFLFKKLDNYLKNSNANLLKEINTILEHNQDIPEYENLSKSIIFAKDFSEISCSILSRFIFLAESVVKNHTEQNQKEEVATPMEATTISSPITMWGQPTKRQKTGEGQSQTPNKGF